MEERGWWMVATTLRQGGGCGGVGGLVGRGLGGWSGVYVWLSGGCACGGGLKGAGRGWAVNSVGRLALRHARESRHDAPLQRGEREAPRLGLAPPVSQQRKPPALARRPSPPPARTCAPRVPVPRAPPSHSAPGRHRGPAAGATGAQAGRQAWERPWHSPLRGALPRSRCRPHMHAC